MWHWSHRGVAVELQGVWPWSHHIPDQPRSTPHTQPDHARDVTLSLCVTLSTFDQAPRIRYVGRLKRRRSPLHQPLIEVEGCVGETHQTIDLHPNL